MWTYLSFITEPVPTDGPVADIGTAPAATRMVTIAGGAQWDSLGTNEALRGPKTASYKAVIVGDTPTAIDTIYATWEGLARQRGKLIRLRGDATTEEWCTARLLSVDAQRDAKAPLYLPITLNFQLLSEHWYGKNQIAFIDLLGLDTGVNAYPFPYTGNKKQRDVLIEITAVAVTIPHVVVLNSDSGHQWEFGRTIPVGDTLRVDCGARSVTITGVGYYDDFVPPAAKAEWFLLQPGDNDLVVTITSGGSGHTFRMSFYEAFG